MPPRFTAEASPYRALWERLAKELYDKQQQGKPLLIDEALARQIATDLWRGVKQGVAQATPDFTTLDPALAAAMKENVFVFSAFKAGDELRKASALLTDSAGNIRPFLDFKKDILALNSTYNLRYLEAEYSNAVASAQMAARWQDFAQDEDRYFLRYDTAGDDRVRPAHRALDGITLPASDPFWDIAYPPNDWLCRCNVVKVLRQEDGVTASDPTDSLLKAKTALTKIGKDGKNRLAMFENNVGKTGIIFPEKHPYFMEAQKSAGIFELLGRVGQKLVSEAPADLPTVLLDFTEPISAQFDNIFTKPDEPMRAAFEKALESFNGVIDLKKLGRIHLQSIEGLIEYEGEKVALGLFTPADRLITISRETINQSNDTFTLFHELAHHHDFFTLGKGAYLSGNLQSTLLKEWRTAVFNSDRYNDFKILLDRSEGKIREQIKYLRLMRETYARSVSQYVAIKSQNPNALNSVQENIFSHWDNEDFIPIFKAINNLLL